MGRRASRNVVSCCSRSPMSCRAATSRRSAPCSPMPLRGRPRTAGWSAQPRQGQRAGARQRDPAPAARGVEARDPRQRALPLAARPKALTPLTFSRYGAGQAYGSHVDNPLMQRHPHRCVLHPVPGRAGDLRRRRARHRDRVRRGRDQAARPAIMVAYPSTSAAPGRAGDAGRAHRGGRLGAEPYPRRRQRELLVRSGNGQAAASSTGSARPRTSTSWPRAPRTSCGCGPRCDPERAEAAPISPAWKAWMPGRARP